MSAAAAAAAAAVVPGAGFLGLSEEEARASYYDDDTGLDALSAQMCEMRMAQYEAQRALREGDPAKASPHLAWLLQQYAGMPDQGTPEWLKAREYPLTASNIASCLGINPYKKKLEYLEEKAGVRPREVFNEFQRKMMQYGNDNEDFALKVYMETWCPQHGIAPPEIFRFGLVAHPQFAWLAGSPDGIAEIVDPATGKSMRTLLEVKCPGRRVIKPGEVPAHYMPQLRLLMEIFDLDQAHFIEWKGDGIETKEFSVTVVPRDRGWLQSIMPTLLDCWAQIQAMRKQAEIESGQPQAKSRRC